MNVGAFVGPCAACGGRVEVAVCGVGKRPDEGHCVACGAVVGVPKDREPGPVAPGPEFIQDDIPF